MFLFSIFTFLVWLALVIEHRIATRRHVKMVKDVMTDELRKLQAESLATPGGQIEKN